MTQPVAAPVEPWLDAAEDSLREVAATALARDASDDATRGLVPPTQVGGAYVQLVSETEAVHVGLCGPPEVLRDLAGALLGIDGELSSADITDAMGEIVNMLAGGVKRRLVAARPGLQLGLPFFIHGHYAANERQQLRVSTLLIAPASAATIVVLHETRAPRSPSSGR